MSNDPMVYSGYRLDPSEQLNYTMLGIHNKKTRKIRLIQVEHWNVAPVLDKYIENNIDDEIDRAAALSKLPKR